MMYLLDEIAFTKLGNPPKLNSERIKPVDFLIKKLLVCGSNDLRMSNSSLFKLSFSAWR
jgi:hypothetical protein